MVWEEPELVDSTTFDMAIVEVGLASELTQGIKTSGREDGTINLNS